MSNSVAVLEENVIFANSVLLHLERHTCHTTHIHQFQRHLYLRKTPAWVICAMFGYSFCVSFPLFFYVSTILSCVASLLIRNIVFCGVLTLKTSWSSVLSLRNTEIRLCKERLTLQAKIWLWDGEDTTIKYVRGNGWSLVCMGMIIRF